MFIGIALLLRKNKYMAYLYVIKNAYYKLYLYSTKIVYIIYNSLFLVCVFLPIRSNSFNNTQQKYM